MDVLIRRLREERRALEALEKSIFESLDTSGLQYDALVQQSEGWMRARRGKLTASRFGVICEQSKYATARSYWELLTGRLPPGSTTKIDNDDTRRGVHNEGIALEFYERVTMNKTEASGLFLMPPPLDFLGASPDALILDKRGIVEVKCPGRAHLPTISGEYMAQIQGQIHISGREYCDFVSFHVDSQTVKIWRVSKSEAYWWVMSIGAFSMD
jgi:putative phage-type endonuclease